MKERERDKQTDRRRQTDMVLHMRIFLSPDDECDVVTCREYVLVFFFLYDFLKHVNSVLVTERQKRKIKRERERKSEKRENERSIYWHAKIFSLPLDG